MPTYPVPKRFCLNSVEASALDCATRDYRLSKSDIVRLICLYGPEPPSLHQNKSVRFIENEVFFDESLLSKIFVEVVRQSTNVGQGIAGFEKFLRGIGVEDVSEENIFADPERRPTMEAIVARLNLIAGIIEQVNAASTSLCFDEALALRAPLCRHSCVTIRLESDLYELLCLKAEAFGLAACDYLRLCLRYLPCIIEFAREHTVDGDFQLNDPLCLQVLELDSLLTHFCECGRVLNDAVRYLNSEMVGYYRLFETMLMLKLRTFLGKLEVAVGFYRCFCDDFGFEFEK